MAESSHGEPGVSTGRVVSGAGAVSLSEKVNPAHRPPAVPLAPAPGRPAVAPPRPGPAAPLLHGGEGRITGEKCRVRNNKAWPAVTRPRCGGCTAPATRQPRTCGVAQAGQPGRLLRDASRLGSESRKRSSKISKPCTRRVHGRRVVARLVVRPPRGGADAAAWPPGGRPRPGAGTRAHWRRGDAQVTCHGGHCRGRARKTPQSRGSVSAARRPSALAAPPHATNKASSTTGRGVPRTHRHTHTHAWRDTCDSGLCGRRRSGDSAVRGSGVPGHVFAHIRQAGGVGAVAGGAEARQCGPGGDAGEAERGACGVARARLPRHPAVGGVAPPGWRRRTPSETPSRLRRHPGRVLCPPSKPRSRAVGRAAAAQSKHGAPACLR